MSSGGFRRVLRDFSEMLFVVGEGEVRLPGVAAQIGSRSWRRGQLTCSFGRSRLRGSIGAGILSF